jgi:hypothetical protein
MLYSRFKNLLTEGLVRVVGRPDGIHIETYTLTHSLMKQMLIRNERLRLASYQAGQKTRPDPQLAFQAFPCSYFWRFARGSVYTF